MISKIFKSILTHDNLKIIVFFSLSLSISYYLVLHELLNKWHSTRINEQELKSEWTHLKKISDASNPFEHDPLIHYLIKLAKSHGLTLITTQFNPRQHLVEEFSCSTAGTYLNTLTFVKELFSSDYILHLEELDIKSQLNNELIQAHMVFKHDL